MCFVAYSHSLIMHLYAIELSLLIGYLIFVLHGSCVFLPRDAPSAKRGIAIACRLSVRLSVCLSVCPSVCDVGEL